MKVTEVHQVKQILRTEVMSKCVVIFIVAIVEKKINSRIIERILVHQAIILI